MHSLSPNGEAARRAAERYLSDVVEALDLCPWSGPARRAGRVHLEVVPAAANAEQCAQRLGQLSEAPGLDAVLLLFDCDADDPRWALRAFETFLRELRSACRAHCAEPFYSVLFHPQLTEGSVPRTAYSLVRTIRRSPVPMIQCLRVAVMEAARARGQAVANARLAETAAIAQPARARGPVLTDPQLSEDVAQRNYARYGAGAGRRELEARLAGCSGPVED